MKEESCKTVEYEPVFHARDPDRLIAEGYRVSIRQYIVQGWRIFTAEPGKFLIYAVIFWIINIALEMVPVVGPFVAPVLMYPIFMGFFTFSAKILKEEPARFEDFLSSLDFFIPLVIVGILANLLILLGLFLFILPGVYLAVGYLFSSILVIDRGMRPWEAMETSRKIITKQWMPIFGLALILLLINFAGALLFIVGLIPATAISACILTAAYDDIAGIASTDWKREAKEKPDLR